MLGQFENLPADFLLVKTLSKLVLPWDRSLLDQRTFQVILVYTQFLLL